MKIVVASLSSHKTSAVAEVGNELFKDTKVEVVGIGANSDINDQPVGLDGIYSL